MHNLRPGMRVSILQGGTEKIDEALVCRVGTGGTPTTDKIEVESLNLHPKEKTEFALIGTEWRMLFDDPMDNSRVYSQRAPFYTFEEVTV